MCGCRKITYSTTDNKNRISDRTSESKTDCEILELEVVIRITEVAHLSGVSSFLNKVEIHNLESALIESALVNIVAEEKIDVTEYEYSKENNGSIVFFLENRVEYDPEIDSMIISIITESGSHHCIKNIYS